MTKWISILKTGLYSDTYIFLIGVYDKKEEAEIAAAKILQKATDLAADLEESGEHDREERIIESHQFLFNIDYYFPPRPRKDWEIVVDRVCDDTILRLF